MTGPNAGSRGQTRPYWARVIGHYEGVMGVKMQYSEMALQQLGIDGGGTGSTAAANDHLGYSRPHLHLRRRIAPPGGSPDAPEPRHHHPTDPATGELGGLTKPTPPSTTLRGARHRPHALARLPDGEADTGRWAWNTGEQTREISIVADRSTSHRATYTTATA
jgi:hypothetical protein